MRRTQIKYLSNRVSIYMFETKVDIHSDRRILNTSCALD